MRFVDLIHQIHWRWVVRKKKHLKYGTCKVCQRPIWVWQRAVEAFPVGTLHCETGAGTLMHSGACQTKYEETNKLHLVTPVNTVAHT